MKYIITLLLLSFSVCFCSAQEDGDEDAFQTLKGRVIDKDSKAPLWGAMVVIVDSGKFMGSVTDSAGYFKIANAPVGRLTIKIKYIGYEDLLMNNVLVTSEKDISLNIQMTESAHQMNAVTVVAKIDKEKALNSMASVSARSFSIEEAERYAGGITDPARMAQAYAGVAATSNDNNEIVVRGNSPRGLLWRIEGVEIPNPNHFQEDEGASGGGVCILSSNVISNSDFYTSAFPAEYGNALSGVFDLNLRKGSDEFVQSSVQASVVGTEISLEGPIYKMRESSYLINYRYSTFALLDKVGIKVSSENITPKFQDLTFNLSLPSKKLGDFTVFGIMGKSSSGIKAVKDSLLLVDKTSRYEEFDQGNMWITGITNNYLAANKKTYYKSVIAVTGTDNKLTADTMDMNFNDQRIYNEDIAYTAIRTSFMANHKFNAKHTIRAGVIYSDEFYSLYSAGYDFETKPLQNKLVFDNKGSTSVLQSYMQWKYNVTEKLTLNTGIHYLRYFLNNNNSLEPRFGLTYQINENHALSAGLGLHSRIEPISVYLTNIPKNGIAEQPNKNLGLSKSLHAVVGYDVSLWQDVHLKAEAYYQYLYDIPVGMDSTNNQFSVLNLRYGFVTTPLSNQGKGQNYGLDLTFEKYFTKGYYYMISGSLYNSQYTPADGKLYNTAFNGHYIFNALAGKEWNFGSKKNKTIGLNFRFLYRGGMRYQGIDLAASNVAAQAVYIRNENYTHITPDVNNVDIGVDFKLNRKKYSWDFKLDLNNLTNQKNIIGMKYNVYTGTIKYQYDLLLLPIASVKVNF
jgi:hypothetical protein